MLGRKVKSQRGAALLIVVTLIAILSLMVVEFQREARVESNYAYNSLASLEAHGLIRSGASAGVAMLKTIGTGTVDRSEYWLNEDGHVIPVGEHAVGLKIEDQYGKFPIGALVDANGKVVPEIFDGYVRLLDELQIEELDTKEAAWALVDWIDDDATDDQYEFNVDFTVPDSVPEHLDELSRIEIYNELAPFDFKEIISHLDTRKTKEINVNTASIPVLVSISPHISPEDAADFYDQLTDNPADSPGSLSGWIPVSGRALTPVFTSSRLRFILEADVRGVRRTADCIVEKDKNNVFNIADWTEM